jgi:ligand-binding sensor domain-containing protein
MSRVWGNGIDWIDRKTDTFTHYTPDSHGLGDDQVTRLYEASSEPGVLWAGTQSGLSRFDTNGRRPSRGGTGPTERFTNYHAENLQRTTMMHEDRQRRFWVTTSGSGLHLFNRETGLSDEIFTTDDGLAHNIVESIYEDNQGFLWLSTQNGLSKFDPERRSFRNYYASDGLPGNAFLERPHYLKIRYVS